MLRRLLPRRTFANYTAVSLFTGTAVVGLIAVYIIDSVLPSELWKVTQQSTQETIRGLESTISSHLRVGDWSGTSKALDAQNSASNLRTQFLVFRGDTESWIGTPKISSETLHFITQQISECTAKNRDCIWSKSFIDNAYKASWRAIVSPNLDGYAAPSLRIVALVSTDSINLATLRLKIFIGGLFAVSAILFLVLSTAILAKRVGKPLTIMAAALKSPGAHAKDLDDILQNGTYEEVRIVAAAVRELWSRIAIAEKEKSEQLRNMAIARTTQMLAHDVRKPFSMLKMTIDMLNKTRSHEDVRKILSTASVDVTRAMAQVNGLIQDVMEIDTKREINSETVNVKTLVHAVLTDSFRLAPKADISIEYKFEHSGDLFVDIQRVIRVFLNIIGNAVQAMKQHGKLWLHTHNHHSENGEFVLFVLGNSGPHIASDDLEKLFDAFFTKNKKGGTGLGLAIAKKVVTSHGGEIWCKSAADVGVEFFFTLPKIANSATTEAESNADATLHAHAHDFLNSPITDGGVLIEVDETIQEGAALVELKARKTPLRILVVDDEALYRNAIVQHLSEPRELASSVSIETALGSADAIRLATQTPPPHLIILDVDLGTESLNGFETLQKMREKNVPSFVCIHTNRVLATDNQEAFRSGADAFLPKPMARIHLLKLIIQAMQKEVPSEVNDHDTINLSNAPKLAMRIAIVDDDPLVHMGWEMNLGTAIAACFDSPEKFFAYAESNPSFINSLTCVVTDFHFDTSSHFNGVEFATQLRALKDVPVLLSTNATLIPNDYVGIVHAVIPKEPPETEDDFLAFLATKT